MGGEHRTAAINGGNKALCNLSIAHVLDQSVNGVLPFQPSDLRGNALVGYDPGIVLRHGCEDQYTTAMSGIGEAAQEELLNGPAMGSSAPDRPRHKRHPQRRPG